MVWRLNGIVPWAISVLVYYIPSSLWRVPITHYATCQELLHYSAIKNFRFLLVFDSVASLLDFMSWSPYFRGLVWIIFHLWSCGWLCKMIDEEMFGIPSCTVTVCSWTLNTLYGPGVCRRNLLYPRFAGSFAASDAIVTKWGGSKNTQSPIWNASLLCIFLSN